MNPLASGQVVSIKIFLGGKKSVNEGFFRVAISQVIRSYETRGIHISCSYISVEDVKKNSWELSQFTDWLKDSDVYFFLSHPVQGISDVLPWNLTNLGNFLYEELKSSIGYPQSDKLLCPVFLQDKLFRSM